MHNMWCTHYLQAWLIGEQLHSKQYFKAFKAYKAFIFMENGEALGISLSPDLVWPLPESQVQQSWVEQQQSGF